MSNVNWDLTYLFKDRNEFLLELEGLKSIILTLKDYQGKLANEEKLKDFLYLQLELECKIGKAYMYAHLKSDLNKKDVESLTDFGMCQNLLYLLNNNLSFVEPEIILIGKDKILKVINSDEKLKQYNFYFEKIFRMEKYILSDKEESILSICSKSMNASSNLYSSLAVSDSENKEVILKDGTKVLVTQGNWSSLVCNAKCEEDKQTIFEALYEKYDKHKNTFAQIYQNVMDSNLAVMQARGYNSILESFLYHNNIDPKVYETLVKVARNENSALKKYISLRKEYLGLKEYHTYDRFAQLAKSDKKYDYEEAKKLFFASIEKFPEDFKKKAFMALEDGFVDVYEKDGKRTGAYSSSQTNLRPYILLNYAGELDDVFTVAHEAGHSIHSLYAMENNPEMLQGYTIFVAEIASTFNEHNLLDYLMNSGSLDKNDKIYLIQKAIDSIVSTFYRQTLFADYELEVSKMVEKGTPLNHEVLSNVMIKLYSDYYGIDITKENVKKFVWAYIPHLFYTPFYVYQYATSFAASFKLYDGVAKGEEGAFDRYVGLLKMGGSKYPMDEALESGIDFTKEETFLAVTKRMEYLVDELEKLLKE